MSDLQCAATLLMCRTAEAGSDVPGLLNGDGQAGPLSELGRTRVRELAERLRTRRVAAVYSSQMARAVESAEIAADTLGVQALAVEGLQERSAVARFREALEGIADLHRGETVLVFGDGGVMSLAIPRLAANAPDDLAARRSLPSCAPVQIAIDADGWRLDAWPGWVPGAIPEARRGWAAAEPSEQP